MQKSIEPLRRTQVNLTHKQHETLGKIAADKGIRVSELLRRIVDDYIEAVRAEAPHKEGE